MQNTEKHPIWEELVNQAYDGYSNSGWNYTEFLFSLNHSQKMAVLLANLNYQVENGGVEQWIFNRYAKEYEQLRIALSKLGTVLAVQVRERLDALRDEYPGLFTDQNYDIEKDPSLIEKVEAFDDWYYSINEEFMDEIEGWLQANN